MNTTEIINALKRKIAVPTGRHLYGVLGSYPAIEKFANNIRRMKISDGKNFPGTLNVNLEILNTIPEKELLKVIRDEAKRPEPTRSFVTRAFEQFLRHHLEKNSFLILSNLELLFAYEIELSPLRTLAINEKQILLLLPGKRIQGNIILFPEMASENRKLPINLVAENHLWELTYDN